MGKLNFSNCTLVFDPKVARVDAIKSQIKVDYNFKENTDVESKIKIYLNTAFIQNLTLEFKVNEEITIVLELRKGEENFVYGYTTFTVTDSFKIPLYRLNPYTSSIDITLLNNNSKGEIVIQKGP